MAMPFMRPRASSNNVTCSRGHVPACRAASPASPLKPTFGTAPVASSSNPSARWREASHFDAPPAGSLFDLPACDKYNAAQQVGSIRLAFPG